MRLPSNYSELKLFCRKVIAYSVSFSLVITPAASFSIPVGGNVSDGTASINNVATGVVVNQSTDKAVIDWQGFDVGSGESAKFNVPNGNSFTLNRVHSDNASQIYGKVASNGQLMVINRNGVVFGKDSQVDVNGLVATTSDISNQDFMAGKNNFHSGGNENASVENHGTITIRNGGSAALVAPNVKNSGTINANMGKVALAAGDTFTIDPYGDGLVQLAVPEHMARGAVENSGTINANGGKVQLAASLDDVTDSLINLNGAIHADNGKVDIKAGVVDQTGKISAKNGTVKIKGNKVSEQGVVVADGGSIDIGFKKAYIDSAQAKLSVSGNKAGSISLKGEKGSTLFASGNYDASSSTGKGGTIKATASDVKLYAATMDASGKTGGGTIHVGGGFQGTGDLMHADTTAINPYATLKADTTTSGKGGEVVVWSDIETRFGGNASAKGGLLGDGGMIEVSSKDKLNLSGTTDVSSIFGKPGSILLDPKNIIISTTGQSYPTYELIDPSFSVGNNFGQNILALGNGNVVITSSGDDFAAADAGAVYLYNGTTGALISTLRGSTASDFVGGSGITLLTGNNNFVIRSPNWDNVAAADAGAVAWGSGTLGVSGFVSAANSLVGTQANDRVGNTAIFILSNGNYIARSTSWDNGVVIDAGAVTWGNGATGTIGAVSAANSLVGTQTSDGVGAGGITPLSNGNYVVSSSSWDNGIATDAGAATWGNGLGGTVGAVSAANSLVGTQTNDSVGGNGIIILTNGNYVIRSGSWDNGGVVDAGAATWGNGLGGTVGAVDITNSLVGTQAFDGVANNTVNALTNGNYVVTSPSWDNGGTFNAGAATWGNGLGGTVGAVSAANSLVGTQTSDGVGAGGAIALSNGNYVVRSSVWDNGAVVNAGAVTWGNGLSGTAGAVDITNSLVGTQAFDSVSNNGITALNNGNYVVQSTAWRNGANANAGAVTWGNGLGGTAGAVDITNSLVGTQANDLVGGNGITALSNGNYVVQSQSWRNGANASAGAVTWGNGLGGTVGAVDITNSLVGTQANDRVGFISSLVVLTNGNYVVRSPFWSNGANTSAGAATWGNGLGGTVGAVSAANSLVGSQASDQVGNYAVTALNNGNYFVQSPNWRNGANANAGAITWGNGLSGTAGAVDITNSLVGTQTGDQLGNFGSIALTNGNYVVRSPNWDSAFADVGAVTWGNGLGGTVGVVSATNSLVGTQVNDQVGNTGVTALSNGNYVVRSSSWDGAVVNAGAFTWGNGLGGTVGAVSIYNSIVGAGSGIGNTAENSSTSTFIARVTDAGRAYVASSSGPSALTFNSFAPNDVTINPNYLTNTLNTGANITLQASNDITVASPVTVAAAGAGGALTLQAGRSILVNADITTDNGNLNLIANSTAADGVVNAQRDVGNADITMGVGTTINAGTGNVLMQIKDGAGNTNNARGNITTRTINAGTFLADNTGTGDNIISGAITTSAAGNNLVMSTRGNINNVFGVGALTTGVGRFLLYGANPATSTLNGLVANFTEFNRTYIANPPASIAALGNGLLWALSLTPVPTGGGGGAPQLALAPEPVIVTPTPTSVPQAVVPAPASPTPVAPVVTITQEIAARILDNLVIDQLKTVDEEFPVTPTVVRKTMPQPSVKECVYSDRNQQSNCLISMSGSAE